MGQTLLGAIARKTEKQFNCPMKHQFWLVLKVCRNELNSNRAQIFFRVSRWQAMSALLYTSACQLFLVPRRGAERMVAALAVSLLNNFLAKIHLLQQDGSESEL